MEHSYEHNTEATTYDFSTSEQIQAFMREMQDAINTVRHDIMMCITPEDAVAYAGDDRSKMIQAGYRFV